MQFDVYRNPDAATAERAPYVVAMNADDVLPAGVLIAAPLVLDAQFAAPDKLTPAFAVEGQTLRLSTLELAAVPARLFGAPVASLKAQRDKFAAAIDLLFTGI